MTCPSCTSDDLVDFTLAPRDEPLRFTHCRSCEHGWWQAIAAQRPLDLPSVLDRIGARA